MESLDAIKQETRNIVLDILPNVTSEDLLDDRDLFSMGLDSITAMTLVLNLQETFGVMFEACEISFENFKTIAKIVELIGKKNDAYVPL